MSKGKNRKRHQKMSIQQHNTNLWLNVIVSSLADIFLLWNSVNLLINRAYHSQNTNTSNELTVKGDRSHW